MHSSLPEGRSWGVGLPCSLFVSGRCPIVLQGAPTNKTPPDGGTHASALCEVEVEKKQDWERVKTGG